MRQLPHVKLALLALAVTTTLVIGAKSVTNAAGDPPLTADDVEHGGPVYRTSPYDRAGDPEVTLTATGGSGTPRYRIVEQPTADGERIGTATVDGDTATLSIRASATPGPAMLRYRAVDEHGHRSNIATVTFDVDDVAPRTRNQEYSTYQNTPVDIRPYARDVEDGGPFPWQRRGTRIGYRDPEHGSLRAFLDRGERFARTKHRMVYVPDRGYVGQDTFTYTFTDSDGETSTGTITVHVREAPESPAGTALGVRYRCTPRGADDSGDQVGSRILSSAFGGDIALRLDARTRVPETVRPGQRFRIGRPMIRARLTHGLTELLAGTDITGGDLDLSEVGLGQRRIAARTRIPLVVDESATGRRSRPSLGPFTADARRLKLPAPANGAVLPMRTGGVGMVAAESGNVTISLPRTFAFVLRMRPGLQGTIRTIPLDCAAADPATLRLARIPVRQRTHTSAVLGVSPGDQVIRIGVRVTRGADGKARVYAGEKRIAVTRVRDGDARLRVKTTAIPGDTRRLRIDYGGARHYGPSATTLRLPRLR